MQESNRRCQNSLLNILLASPGSLTVGIETLALPNTTFLRTTKEFKMFINMISTI